MIFIFLVIFILLLYLVTVQLTSRLYGLFFLVSSSQKLALGMLSLILLPGTIVHEMSHFFMATILRVPTGKMSIFPEALEKGKVRAGKLEIGECDPFRKTIIGIAPIIIGLTIIYLVGMFFFPSFQLPTTNYQLITTIICLYFLLTISSTMFSSPKDLESLIIVLPIISILFLFLYFIGLRITLTGNILTILENIIKKLNSALIITIVTDFGIVVICTLFIQLFQRILKRNLVEK